MGNVLRVASKATSSIKSFDPAFVKLDTEAFTLDLLYSPLVRVNEDGEITPALAERYYWIGNEIHFVIRKSLRASDGSEITAKDAEFSLKRILTGKTNTHGDLRPFLSSFTDLQSVDEECPSVRVEDNELIISIANSRYKSFLLKLLANVDFGIIPVKSFDSARPVPNIQTHGITSGAYFVQKDDSHGSFILKANSFFWETEASGPSELKFVASTSESAIDLLKSDSIDVIPSVLTEPSFDLDRLKEESKFNFFETLPIRRLLVATTKEQLGSFSPQERQAIYAIIRRATLSKLPKYGWQPAEEFFPFSGEGSLSTEQRKEFNEWRTSVENTPIHRPFTLGVSFRRMDFFKAVLGSNPMVQLVEISQVPAYVPLGKRPDFYITGTDAGYQESISLINSLISQGLLILSEGEKEHWLKSYMEEEDKSARLDNLRKLHLRSLKEGTFGMLAEGEYIAVMKKPWIYNAPKIFASAPLWKMRKAY